MVLMQVIYFHALALSSALSSQLRYDGYETAASSLAHTISSYPPTSPSSRLSHLVQLGLQTEGEGEAVGDIFF